MVLWLPGVLLWDHRHSQQGNVWAGGLNLCFRTKHLLVVGGTNVESNARWTISDTANE